MSRKNLLSSRINKRTDKLAWGPLTDLVKMLISQSKPLPLAFAVMRILVGARRMYAQAVQ